MPTIAATQVDPSQEEVLSASLIRFEAQKEALTQGAPLLRFETTDLENVLALLTQGPKTLVMTGEELKSYQMIILYFIESSPHHRLHVVLSDAAFLKEVCLCIPSEYLPKELHHLILSDIGGQTETISKNLLYNRRKVISFEMRNFDGLRYIDDKFLSLCHALTDFKTTPFRALTSVGDYFIHETALDGFNTENFPALTQVGDLFLSVNPNLKELDTKGFTALVKVGRTFVSGHPNLERVDLGGLSALSHVDKGFFASCPNLKSFNIEKLVSLKDFGRFFLYCALSLPQEEKDKITAFWSIKGVTCKA